MVFSPGRTPGDAKLKTFLLAASAPSLLTLRRQMRDGEEKLGRRILMYVCLQNGGG